MVITLLGLFFQVSKFLNKVNITTSISSRPSEIVPQMPKVVPIIPTTFGYPSLVEKVLESTNFVSRVKGCE